MNTRLVEHGNRKATPDVPDRVKAAAEILATTPGAPDYAALAAAVGYRDARALRRALSLPQSIRFLRDYKRQTLEEINLHNPEALRKVRDGSQNGMAVTAAVRQLEIMGGEDANGVGHAQRPGPGVTIVFTSAPPVKTIDVTPEPDFTDPHHWPSVR